MKPDLCFYGRAYVTDLYGRHIWKMLWTMVAQLPLRPLGPRLPEVRCPFLSEDRVVVFMWLPKWPPRNEREDPYSFIPKRKEPSYLQNERVGPVRGTGIRLVCMTVGQRESIHSLLTYILYTVLLELNLLK